MSSPDEAGAQSLNSIGANMARWLGYLGLIPFLAGGALALTGEPATRDVALRAVIAYGAVIVSFLGGIHWGLALRAGANRAARLLFVSVIPSLAGWLAVLLTPGTGLQVLIATFVFVWFYERATLWQSDFPAWFVRLRTHLTAVALIVLLALSLA